MKKQNEDLGIVLPHKVALFNYPIKNSIGWTISLPRNVLIPISQIRPKPDVKKGTIFLNWYKMTIEAQWNYIVGEYVPDLFKYCHIKKMHMFPELNKRRDIHAHCVIFSDDPEWDVMIFTKKCSHHWNSQRIHKGKNEARLNCIHTIESRPIEWVDYIQKDCKRFKHLKPFII